MEWNCFRSMFAPSKWKVYFLPYNGTTQVVSLVWWQDTVQGIGFGLTHTHTTGEKHYIKQLHRFFYIISAKWIPLSRIKATWYSTEKCQPYTNWARSIRLTNTNQKPCVCSSLCVAAVVEVLGSAVSEANLYQPLLKRFITAPRPQTTWRGEEMRLFW